MPKAKRKIKKAEISHISLCPKGANKMQAIYKSFEGLDKECPVQISSLVKELEEGVIAAVVYSPDSPDADGDFASKEVVKEMCYGFAANKGGVDIRHSFSEVPKDVAFVAESFIIQKADPRFSDIKDDEGKLVDCEGSWGIVLKIEDENLKKLYREKEWVGVSIGGKAEFEPVKKEKSEEDDSDKTLNIVQKILASLNLGSGSKQQENDQEMKEDDVKKLVKEELGTQLGTFKEELLKALKPEDKKTEKSKEDLEKELASQKAEIERIQKESKANQDRLDAINKGSNQDNGKDKSETVKKSLAERQDEFFKVNVQGR